MSTDRESNPSLSESLLEQLECPVCGEYCTTPIYTCSDGHNVCHRCQPTLTECPVCGVDGKPVGRCLIAEKIATLFKFHLGDGREADETVVQENSKSKFSKAKGGKLMRFVACRDKQQHYRCAIYYIPSRTDRQRCVWEGGRRDLANHVRSEHPRHYADQECVAAKLRIGFDKRIDYTVLVAAHAELFWVEFWYDLDDSTAYLWASYVGTPETAAKYECEFKYGTARGHVQVTSRNQILAERESVFASPSVLPLEEVTIDKLLSDGYFCFTARILKK